MRASTARNRGTAAVGGVMNSGQEAVALKRKVSSGHSKETAYINSQHL